MKIALVVYPGFTALDIIGPFQVLVDVPGHEVEIVAEHAGPVTDHTGKLTLTATASLAELTDPDIVVVAGALEDRPPDPPVVEWLRRVHRTTTWTTSVCTGSLYLAAAGILDGLDATCHWARAHRLEEYGVPYSAQRIVRHERVMTGAGVSAGVDMALRLLDELYGPSVARTVQLAIEYDPEPPHDCGSPAKAEAELVDLVRAVLNPGQGRS